MNDPQENLKKLIGWLLFGRIEPAGNQAGAMVENRVLFNESNWEIRTDWVFVRGVKKETTMIICKSPLHMIRQTVRVPFDEVSVSDVADALYMVLDKCRLTKIEVIKEQSDFQSYSLVCPDGPVEFDEIQDVIDLAKRHGTEAFL